MNNQTNKKVKINIKDNCIYIMLNTICPLSVSNYPKDQDKSKTLIVEILTYSQHDPCQLVYKPYVSPVLAQGNPEQQERLEKYQQCELPVEFELSGIIFEAWKQGFFYDNRENYSKLKEILFIKSANLVEKLQEIKKTLKVADPEEWPPHNPLTQKDFEDIEFDVIHKIDRQNQNESYYLIVYPLIIDDYLYIGLSYLIAVFGDKYSDIDSDIFQENCYIKCRDIILNIGAGTLKQVIAEQIIEEIDIKDWQNKHQSEIFKDVLKRYLPCFVVGEQCEHDSYQKITYKLENANNHSEISIYVPQWIKDNFEPNVISEINFVWGKFQQECEKQERKRMEDISYMSASYVHTFKKTGDAIKDMAEKYLILLNEQKEVITTNQITRSNDSDSLLRSLPTESYEIMSFKYLLDWYIKDASQLYECVVFKNAFDQHFNDDNQRNLAFMIIKSFINATLIARSNPEFRDGYMKVFQKFFEEDNLTEERWLILHLNLQNHMNNFNLLEEIVNKIKEYIEFSIDLNNLYKISLLSPEPKEDTKYIYWEYWEKIFTECFLNFFKQYCDIQLEIVKLSIEFTHTEDRGIITFSNPTSRQLQDEQSPITPNIAQGKRAGLGLYGNFLWVERILKIGEFTTAIYPVDDTNSQNYFWTRFKLKTKSFMINS